MNLVEEFKKIAGDIKIIDKEEEKEMYSHDIGDVPTIMTKTFFEIQPDFVVQPKSAEEIKKVLEFANEKKSAHYTERRRIMGIWGCNSDKCGNSC